MVIGNWTIGIAVKWNYTIHKVPYLFVISMEDVCSILMNIDTFHFFAIDVSTQLRAFVYHKAFLSLLLGLMSKCGTKEARAYYKVIVHILCIVIVSEYQTAVTGDRFMSPL